MNAASLFYTEGVTGSQALEVATFLAAAGLFNGSPKVAQLGRSAAGFEFRLAVEVDPVTQEMAEGARQMAYDLSRNVLGGMPIDVQYCMGLRTTLRPDTLSADAPRDTRDSAPGGPFRSQVFVRPSDKPDE
jgi:hypothetical protein